MVLRRLAKLSTPGLVARRPELSEVTGGGGGSVECEEVGTFNGLSVPLWCALNSGGKGISPGPWEFRAVTGL